MARTTLALVLWCCWLVGCGDAQRPNNDNDNDDGGAGGGGGGGGTASPACDINHSCEEGSEPCTFESGPCSVTLECLGAEGGNAWQGTEATCDVPPVPCNAEQPEEYGDYPDPLLTPLATGDRCAFAGDGCPYRDDAGCRAMRECLADHTWGAATTECDPWCHDSQVGDSCESTDVGVTCGWFDQVEMCTHERTCNAAHVWEGTDSC